MTLATRKPEAPPRPDIPSRVLLIDGPAAGRDVPGSEQTVIRLVRRGHSLLYARDPDSHTAFFIREV